MKIKKNLADDSQSSSIMIDLAIKLVAISVMVIWCFQILSPFILPIIWAAILAIALFPLYKKLVKLTKGRKGLASTIFALVGIAILVVPTFKFSTSAVDSLQQISTGLQTGSLEIPEPNENVKDWPIVGKKLYPLWLEAADNLESFAANYSEQIRSTFSKILSAAASFGGVILQFIISIIIAAFFMAKSESCNKGINLLLNRLMGEHATVTIKNSVATVRSVAQGILGIAFIQALLAGIGLVIVDIPAAGLWVLLVLLFSIVQIPQIIILLPISAYYFSVADSTTAAVIFFIWMIFVGVLDGILKPLLLGRGTNVPMIVILLGAIGGMILSGIIGLFTGAVILALGYQLMNMWLEKDQPADVDLLEK